MKSRRNRLELLFFSFIVIAVLFPAWFLPQLFSLDGGVHIYNARLIKNMFLHADHWGHFYYDFIAFPVPNWFGHFITILLLFFTNSLTALKIHQLLLLISFIVSWRWVLIRAKIQNRWAAHLGVLFVWSWFVVLGFHNFLWGIVFALVLMAISLGSPSSYRALAYKSFMLSGLLYFSHPTLFLIGLVWVGSYRIIQLFSSSFQKTKGLNGLIAVVIGGLPWLGLLSIFILKRKTDWGNNTHLPFSTKLEMMEEVNPLLLFNGDYETPLIHYSLLIIVLMLLASFYIVRRNRKQGKKEDLQMNKPFLLATLFIVLAAFIGFLILPDSTPRGSFISIRMLFLVLLFLLLVCTYLIRKSVVFVLAYLVFFGIQINRIQYYTKTFNNKTSELNQLNEWGKDLEPGSLVVCINDGSWFHENLEMQFALSNDIVCIENFEAATGYFPLFWKKGKYPVPGPEQQLFNHKGELLAEIDYVFWIRNGTNTKPALRKNALKLIKSKDSYFLFQWNP